MEMWANLPYVASCFYTEKGTLLFWHKNNIDYCDLKYKSDLRNQRQWPLGLKSYDILCKARRCQDLSCVSTCSVFSGWLEWCVALEGALKSPTFVQTVMATSSLSVWDLHQSPRVCGRRRGNDYQLEQFRTAADTCAHTHMNTHTHIA